jgi:hypothetical protein
MKLNVRYRTASELNHLLTESLKMTRLDTQNAFMNAIRSRNFIVGSVDASGNLSFASNPTLHTNRTAARAEASRLAKLNPGKLYTFVELAGAELVPNQTVSI